MRLTRYTTRLLGPEIAVPVVYTLFLLFAFLSYELEGTRRYLTQASPLGFLLSFLGIFALILFICIGSRLGGFPSRPVLAIIFAIGFLALYRTFSLPLTLVGAVSGGYAIVLLLISKKLDRINLITFSALFLAILSSVMIFSKGIPIFEPLTREGMAVNPTRAFFHGSAVFSATLLAAFYDRKFLLGVPFLAILAIALGFKSDAIAVLVSAGIAASLVKRPRISELTAVLIGAVLIFTVVSTHIASMSYGVWRIPPLLYIFYRAGFTLSVFDRIAVMSLPLGYTHGEALLDPTQQIVSTAVLDYEVPHIITSTLIGPGTLDFGIMGLLFTCAFVGLYLGAMHRLIEKPVQTCFYAIALTHTFILIEVGIQLTSVLFYLSLLYLSLKAKD